MTENPKILLIRPPAPSAFALGLPIGLLSLADKFRLVNISVEILDLGSQYSSDSIIDSGMLDQWAELIILRNPLIAAFSVQCCSMPIVIALSNRLRRVISSKIVIGGPQSIIMIESIHARKQLNHYFDACFCGASDYMFIEYCCSILPHLSDRLNDLKTRKFSEEPFPDVAIIPKEILAKYDPVAYIDNARGCPGRCSFCAEHRFWGNLVQSRSPFEVIKYIRHLGEKYGINRFEFTHDNFCYDRVYLKTLLQELRDLKSIKWTCRTRLDSLDIELATTLKESGCDGVLIGLESPDETGRKRKNEKLTSSDLSKKLNQLEATGIKILLSFIIGAPEDTEISHEQTISFAYQYAQKNTFQVHFHKFSPLPFSCDLDLPLIFDRCDLSDMVSSSHKCLFGDELLEIIAKEKNMCRGFYSLEKFSGLHLGECANILNFIFKYHFRSLRLYLGSNSPSMKNIAAYSEYLSNFDNPPAGTATHPWLIEVARLEKALYAQKPGTISVIDFPENTANIFKEIGNADQQEPSPLQPHLIISHKNGIKNILPIKELQKETLQRISQLIANETQENWRC